MKTNRFVLLVILLAAVNPGHRAAETKPAAKPGAELQPAVSVKGSDTLVRLAVAVAESVKETVKVSVSGGGSGVGIASLANNTVDICTSSRRMKGEELVRIEEDGRKVTELIIGYDALLICVHKDCGLKTVSVEQLQKLWSTGEISTWNDLEVKNPSGEVTLHGQKNTSGAYEFFRGKMKTADGPLPKFVEGIQDAASSEALLQAVAGDESAMGYAVFGSKHAGVKFVEVSTAPEAKAVPATSENVISGIYPLSRPLYLYTTTPDAPGVKEFLAFARSEAGQKLVAAEGFAPLPATTKPGGK